MKKIFNNDWDIVLNSTIDSQEFKDLSNFILNEQKEKSIFPKGNEIFRAFKETSYKNTKIVLLTLGSYPNYYKAQPIFCGLPFVPRHKEYIPAALRIILKKIQETIYPDLYKPLEYFDLNTWPTQGILMLNLSLTIEHGKPGSHLEKWNFFIMNVIKKLSKKDDVIFMLWGKIPNNIEKILDNNIVLKCDHPMNSYYYNKDWDCTHFKKINTILKIRNESEIIW